LAPIAQSCVFVHQTVAVIIHFIARLDGRPAARALPIHTERAGRVFRAICFAEAGLAPSVSAADIARRVSEAVLPANAWRAGAVDARSAVHAVAIAEAGKGGEAGEGVGVADLAFAAIIIALTVRDGGGRQTDEAETDLSRDGLR